MVLVALLWRGWWDQAWPWADPTEETAALWVRIGAGLAVGFAGVALSRVWIARSERAARLSDELGRMLGPMTALTAWGLAIASGFGEELLFRGAAQPALGIVLASLLFAAVHYLPGPGLWIWTLYAALAGLALGGLFHWTGDVLAPALAHTVLNGVNLSWLGRQNRAD
jgi:membrane protease YdiL (CAAX protease family)